MICAKRHLEHPEPGEIIEHVCVGQGSGTNWLFPFENGAPPVGWHDALAYLVLPALLIVSQVISQKIISPPKSNDPTQKQMQGFLQFLPFMLGKKTIRC